MPIAAGGDAQSTSDLVIGIDGFALPLAALTRRIVVLGQSDTGKTNTVTDLVEEVLERNLQVVIVDYKGDFWGLQTSADGKKPGYPIVKFGGDNSDVDLHEDAGAAVADVIVAEGFSAILDLSNFEVRAAMKRFVTAFAKRLFYQKRSNPTPLLVVLDEVDQYAPQRPFEGEQVMLGAIETLVRLGRKRGIGVAMTTQAPAIVSKNVLEQGDLYIFHQMSGKNAVKAIEDAVKRNATAEELATISRGIGRLQRGETFVYSPSWLRILQPVTMRRRRTFDSSRTPEVGDEILRPSARATPDIPALRTQIAATIEKAKADDPKALRAEITRLTGELKKRAPEKFVETVTERIEVPVLTPEVLATIKYARSEFESLKSAFEATTDEMRQAMREVGAALVDVVRKMPKTGIAPGEAAQDAARESRQDRGAGHVEAERFSPRPRASTAIPPVLPRPPSVFSGTAPKAGARRMLEQLARSGGTLTKRQLGVLSGVKATSGTFSDYLSLLRKSAYIESDASSVTITPSGANAIGEQIRHDPMSTAEVVAFYGAKLKGGSRRMLDILVEAGGKPVAKAALAERAGISASSGTFSDYLSILRVLGLLENVDSQHVSAADILFQRRGRR